MTHFARNISICFIIIVAVYLSQPAMAQDDITSPCPDDYTGYLSPRLTVGEQARVLAGVAMNIRPQPTTAQARTGVITSGTTFSVTGGPRCNEGYIWWQTDYNGQPGWLAEGNARNATYWLEPRGELVIQADEQGNMRRYIRLDDGFLEPEGCLRPPDDYTIEQIGYARLNTRTLVMLDQAQRIYNANGGDVINFRQMITQGSYNPGGVSASFGTHDGGGAVDLSVRNPLDWQAVLVDEIEPMIEALRTAGFAAWLRDTGDLYPDSPIHIHAIAIGDADASAIAQQQVNSEFGYFNGYDGLPRDDGDYGEDRHGGPVVCGWMRGEVTSD